MPGSANILIVDDNPDFIADSLPMYGYVVSVAKDGLQAIKMLNTINAKYDLILLDAMMPKMDGFQTLKAIREIDRYKSIPIIMVTALNEDQSQVMGLKNGADDYITKPFVLPNLLARIDALLRRAEWGKTTPKISLNINSDAEIDTLTAKQKEIIKYAAKGLSNAEIADILKVGVITVKTHLQAIYKKLKVNSRTQAILLAMQLNILDE